LIKQEFRKLSLSSQVDRFKKKIHEGFSTLIFPEGTTWGYGGIKKIRSAIYQLVTNAFEQHDIKVYILPINVKVDRLARGRKDLFINIGQPKFILKSREDFNQYIHATLQKLHTITFSQIAAYYLKKISELTKETRMEVCLTKEELIDQLSTIARNIHSKVEDKTLPAIDHQLVEKSYLAKKVTKFITYSIKKNYLLKNPQDKGNNTYILNHEKVLAQYPVRLFRKRNPLGFSANELASLGDKLIDQGYEALLALEINFTEQSQPSLPAEKASMSDAAAF